MSDETNPAEQTKRAREEQNIKNLGKKAKKKTTDKGKSDE